MEGHRPTLALRLRNGDKLLVNDQHLRFNGSPLAVARLSLSQYRWPGQPQPRPLALRLLTEEGQVCRYLPFWLFAGNDFQRLLARVEGGRWPIAQLKPRLIRWWPWTIPVLLISAALPLLLLSD